MSKQLFANEKVMTQYLGALLQDDDVDSSLKPVAKLLEQVQPKLDESHLLEHVDKADDVEQNVILKDHVRVPQEQHIEEVKKVVETEVTSKPKVVLQSQEEYFDSEFQALFFEVAGLTLAVPLKSLGGIHQLTEVNHLFGKPKWFKGVMLNRDEKLNVVDTARWVMPEKYDEALEASLNYQYLITLGDSTWGLLAEKLINNITLTKEDVKWRSSNGKRPWLAGVIKDKMCALIDVDNLNTLLEQGLDSRQ
ncbi:chemotaxis protein CheW [Pseudoalteromonas sp. MMG010]|uniref:chemotaxis protein CheW n=1 Tax=Pseudoalteromonas sp. MMG010 TaxID=2822685 RepID=UPI001B3A105C|nr:chemotaxis protein CheW [Pseudoalteromonas sp. MMG010]MBQ4831762.1 chemotaxis protein CheW [Pseudoalteromonas sp. MMG010]